MPAMLAGDVDMRAVSRLVLLMLVVVFAPIPPVAAETTAFFMGYAVSMPSPLVLLMSGWALLGVTASIRERSRKWRS